MWPYRQTEKYKQYRHAYYSRYKKEHRDKINKIAERYRTKHRDELKLKARELRRKNKK